MSGIEKEKTKIAEYRAKMKASQAERLKLLS